MMRLCFFFLLIFTDSALSQCSYRDVVQHLNLTKKKDFLTLTQPITNQKGPLELDLDVLLYAILDVNEKDQLFVSYIWVDAIWWDSNLMWNHTEFCDIEIVNIPTTSVWTPDLTIAEMTEKDKAAQSPYLSLQSNGRILLRNDMVVVSSCTMFVYKFPFDSQKCNLTFKSMIHSIEHIKLGQMTTGKRITEWSRRVMQSKAEWVFIDMTFKDKDIDNFGVNQSIVVYTITMKRRPILYVVNFILPVLLLLCLDLAAFMMPEEDGGKVGFKISVLLAVILMQLLLNEILPSSSNRIPLIVIYCIGIFGLMMVSLLETILVMGLMGKDSAPQDKEADNQSLSEESVEKQESTKVCGCLRDTELFPCVPISGGSGGKASTEMLQVEQEVSDKSVSKKIGYWTRLAKRIHKVFIVLYLLTVAVFLAFMFYSWTV